MHLKLLAAVLIGFALIGARSAVADAAELSVLTSLGQTLVVTTDERTGQITVALRDRGGVLTPTTPPLFTATNLRTGAVITGETQIRVPPGDRYSVRVDIRRRLARRIAILETATFTANVPASGIPTISR